METVFDKDNALYKAAKSFIVFRHDLLLSICATLFFSLLTYSICGFYYVEYEGLFSSLFSGRLTPGTPFPAVYFSGFFGLSYLYSALYTAWPQVEWLSWISYSYLFTACSASFYILLRILPPDTALRTRIFILAITFLLVFADHYIHYVYTRIAYLICGSSLLGLVFICQRGLSHRASSIAFVLLCLFFTVGTLTRLESGLACALLGFFYAFFSLASMRRSLLALAWPVILVGAMSLAISYDIRHATADQFYKRVEPDIEEQLSARGNAVPMSEMKTHRDSAIYLAAVNMMWSDPAVLSEHYLRSLIVPEGPFMTDSRQWHRVRQSLGEMLSYHWHLVGIDILLSFCILVQFRRPKTKAGCLGLWGFVFSFWALTVAQAYTDKINDRSFLPYLSVFFLFSVALLAQSIHRRRSVMIYLLMIPLAVLMLVHISRIISESRRLEQDRSRYQANLKIIKNAAADKYLVVNNSSFDYIFLANIPFHTFDYSAFRKIYIPDGYIIPFLPAYKKYLEKDCQCDVYAFPSLWRYLQAQGQQAAILSTADRMHLVSDYLSTVHGYDPHFTEDTSIHLPPVSWHDHYDNKSDLKIYTFGQRDTISDNR